MRSTENNTLENATLFQPTHLVYELLTRGYVNRDIAGIAKLFMERAKSLF